LPRVNLTLCHVVEKVWCGSDSGSDTCYCWMWKISI